LVMRVWGLFQEVLINLQNNLHVDLLYLHVRVSGHIVIS